MVEYIEREKAIQGIEEDCSEQVYYSKSDAISLLRAQDAADVAPVVHGWWIEKTAPARRRYFECSACGAQENQHTAIKGRFCWSCGARMDGDPDA